MVTVIGGEYKMHGLSIKWGMVFFLLMWPVISAANSLLIWPIYPKILANQKATSVWIENRGRNTAFLQVRIFRWDQRDGQDIFATQTQLLATPPFVQIPAGEKQLIRVIDQTLENQTQEYAFRVLIDELPPLRPPGQPEDQHSRMGVNIRMRYSLPLFVYGKGFAEAGAQRIATPSLQAWLVTEAGEHYLRIWNHGRYHVRLTNMDVSTDENSAQFSIPGLAGYILPNQYRQWPISSVAFSGTRLSFELYGTRYTIPLNRDAS
ncbi:molecular chaperone [Photobacterium sp. TY1-4]|uniref:fimbrial biogenesis chaperone n=1 Tax=Photobacterium sp. TY1-4 TaxID=2899122 RepID=UPI0021BE3BD1|nr:molecular chaperone [Photobacterium sp. TY1-4]UXI02017.1 molecular chaperone [Photobacterium sp. TY1-4]